MSEFIRNSLRQEQEKLENKHLEAQLLEGLDSGEKIEITDEWWNKKKEQLTHRSPQEK